MRSKTKTKTKLKTKTNGTDAEKKLDAGLRAAVPTYLVGVAHEPIRRVMIEMPIKGDGLSMSSQDARVLAALLAAAADEGVVEVER